MIIALSVACGYEYDFEYDWSRSSSPPKKEEVFVIPKAQVVDPKRLSCCPWKSQIAWWRLPISVLKFDHDNDNAETDDEDEDVYR